MWLEPVMSGTSIESENTSIPPPPLHPSPQPVNHALGHAVVQLVLKSYNAKPTVDASTSRMASASGPPKEARYQPTPVAKHVSNHVWNPWENQVVSNPFQALCYITLTYVQTCTLDLVAHLPRVMFSDLDLEVLIWLLKVNGVRNTPSLRQCKALHELLRHICNFEVKHYMGKLGHLYYINCIQSILKHVSDLFSRR
jgi:hypothetical protein